MTYDIIVIGTGPGGYVCAIRAAQLGMKVAVVEKRATHGGTCLNIGCIPSKALLYASEVYEHASSAFPRLGIDAGKIKLNLAAMMKHKEETVNANVNGVAFLLKKNGIDSYTGVGKINGRGEVAVSGRNGEVTTLNTKNIVIATGSEPAVPPGIDVEFDEKSIVSSTGGLSLEKVPRKMAVIGAGVIGLELGSVWRRLGADVTVIEYLDRILPGIDGEAAKFFERAERKHGVTFHLSSKVTKIARVGPGVEITFEPNAGGDSEVLEADVALVSTGRKPYIHGLGLESVGIETERGRIVIDDGFQTSAPGVYAVGDVVRGPMLAHKAEDEGLAVAEIISGQNGHVNYHTIPNIVYTAPEIASVGKSEEELKSLGIPYAVGKFPFSANGRARAMLTTEGFVKILADQSTDRVLGVHIVGANAGELIAEAVVLMEFGGSSEDLARICHGHPTLSEAVREAALGVGKRSIHV